jgi:hypothetical protein
MNPHARQSRWPGLVWVAGLAVALGAGVATAHGLYEVALAAGVPPALAWLYPIITDGLALVAYATTARLPHTSRNYAWTIVVVAAGLSGLTQASYLAGGVASAPPALRFGIGAWPAIAAAIVAHLLFLLRTPTPPAAPPHPVVSTPSDPGSGEQPLSAPAISSAGTPPVFSAVQPPLMPPVQPLNTAPAAVRVAEHSASPVWSPVVRASASRVASPARDRAIAAAHHHAAHQGQLPTVSQLVALAQVSRGTAATALKDLRTQPAQLQVVKSTDEPRSHP